MFAALRKIIDIVVTTSIQYMSLISEEFSRNVQIFRTNQILVCCHKYKEVLIYNTWKMGLSMPQLRAFMCSMVARRKLQDHPLLINSFFYRSRPVPKHLVKNYRSTLTISNHVWQRHWMSDWKSWCLRYRDACMLSQCWNKQSLGGLLQPSFSPYPKGVHLRELLQDHIFIKELMCHLLLLKYTSLISQQLPQYVYFRKEGLGVFIDAMVTLVSLPSWPLRAQQKYAVLVGIKRTSPVNPLNTMTSNSKSEKQLSELFGRH